MIATQWQRQTFRVLTNDVMRNARTQMSGYVHASVPGLAITRSVVSEGFWAITHLHSGTAVLKMLESMTDALVSLRNIAGLCDWTLSAEQIDNLPNRDSVVRALNAELQRYTDFYRLKVGHVSPEALCDVQPRAVREG